MNTAWIILNADTGKYHALDGPSYREVSDPLDAWTYQSEADAIEDRNDLCLLHCDFIWCTPEYEDKWPDLDKFLPEGWDFVKDGEITDGSQLSGPYLVRKLTYSVEE